MPITQFPDVRETTEEGIVALGGDLEPESLILAYSQGIFPWPIPELPLAWFCPPQRAILEAERLHIAKSLRRLRNKNIYQITIDRSFQEVLRLCAQVPRSGQQGTWITDEMVQAYSRLHQKGIAHSVEIWRAEQLVGGIYGVEIHGVFSGESMFHTESNTSKLAVLFLLEHLKTQGIPWIDIQVMTPHMEALGARLIPRDEFLELLKKTQQEHIANSRLVSWSENRR